MPTTGGLETVRRFPHMNEKDQQEIQFKRKILGLMSEADAADLPIAKVRLCPEDMKIWESMNSDHYRTLFGTEFEPGAVTEIVLDRL